MTICELTTAAALAFRACLAWSHPVILPDGTRFEMPMELNSCDMPDPTWVCKNRDNGTSYTLSKAEADRRMQR